MREHIAPVIVMLNKIALGKADAVSLSAVSVDSVYRDRRYCIVLGPAAEHPFHSTQTCGEVIQGVGREGMRPRDLSGYLPGIVQSRELRHRRCRAGKQ